MSKGMSKMLMWIQFKWLILTVNPACIYFFRQLVTRTKKIFVGGLSVTTTIEDVKQYFDQFGKVNKYKN